jgi:peroxiredoxin
VLVFFAESCPCQAAHDARLMALAERYRDRGVDVFAVDPEPGATPDRDAASARRRGYPFPILVDHGGALARRLGAEYATESFVIDRQGVVRFHGGIDSDKSALHDDARPYLRDALDDLLLGHAPRLAEAKALGCALQLW